MAYTLTNLRDDIRNYTEVSSNVLSDTIIEGIVLDAEYRIYRDVPIDAYRDIQVTNFTTDQDFVNSPAGAHVVRAVQVFDATYKFLDHMLTHQKLHQIP